MMFLLFPPMAYPPCATFAFNAVCVLCCAVLCCACTAAVACATASTTARQLLP
jgi:hypothetical protein